MTRWAVTAVAVVCLAVTVRCALIVHLHPWNAPAEENRVIARNIASGDGYTFSDFQSVGPTSIRPPLQPFLLAALDRVLGVESRAALIAAIGINVVAGAAASLLIMAVMKPAGWRAQIVAGIAMAVWPTQAYAATQFQGLPLAVLLSLTAIWLCQKRWPLTAGVVIGTAALCESILLLPLLAAGVWAFRRKPEGLILLPLAALALTVPWAYRNTLVRDRPTGLTNQFAADVFLGNGPGATGSQHLASLSPSGKPLTEFDRLSAQQFDALRHQPEAQRDTLLRGWAADWIGTHPANYAWLCVVRTVKTFWLDWNHPLAFNAANVLSRTVAAIFSLIAIVQWSRLDNAKPMAAMALVMLIGLIAATIFTLAEARNSVLIDVPQLLLAATVFKPKA